GDAHPVVAEQPAGERTRHERARGHELAHGRGVEGEQPTEEAYFEEFHRRLSRSRPTRGASGRSRAATGTPAAAIASRSRISPSVRCTYVSASSRPGP